MLYSNTDYVVAHNIDKRTYELRKLLLFYLAFFDYIMSTHLYIIDYIIWIHTYIENVKNLCENTYFPHKLLCIKIERLFHLLYEVRAIFE